MKVSVITPFYEGNNYIEAYQDMMLKNIEHLSEEDELEVLLVNDSPWEAVSLRGAVATSRNWRIIKNQKNYGIHLSRVHGLMEATGDYVIFLDQDDKLADNAVATFLEEAKKLATETSEGMEGNEICYQVIVSNATLEQKDWASSWYRTDYHKSLVGDLRTYLRIGTQIISPGQCLIPRALIPQFWMENTLAKNGADDYFLWILMLEQGVPFSYLDQELYVHHFTEKNLSADTSVTDTSSFEFIEILREAGVSYTEDLDVLEHMLRFKDAFRRADKAGKIRLAMKNPGLMISNVVFKIRTKTGYGFNR
ncbi:MAG: glycosyltransferase family 2 protein [Lachnospiraceae bacterium]|jgi:glycosyltransferase involved in cell wall biosynthesis|nr:glycosyltransferase family 2 protein [Lachnospiraceae bacterium]